MSAGVLHGLLSVTRREECLEHPKSANYVYYHDSLTSLVSHPYLNLKIWSREARREDSVVMNPREIRQF